MCQFVHTRKSLARVQSSMLKNLCEEIAAISCKEVLKRHCDTQSFNMQNLFKQFLAHLSTITPAITSTFGKGSREGFILVKELKRSLSLQIHYNLARYYLGYYAMSLITSQTQCPNAASLLQLAFALHFSH